MKPPEEAALPPKASVPLPKPKSPQKPVVRQEPEEGAPATGSKKRLPRIGDTWTDPITGMQFVWVPGGTFQMGGGPWAGPRPEGGPDNEKPVHEVQLDGFWMGKYEVTQGQWQQFMGHKNMKVRGNNYPVAEASWNDAQNFISLLNIQSEGNYKFRLPTEAEWEYAARSGGKHEKYAGGSNVDAVAWYSENSGKSTHPVGQKSPNGLGLFDMSGNVWEGCQDVYNENAYSNHPRSNPLNTGGGRGGLSSDGALDRVLRGGGYYNTADVVRCTTRAGYPPDAGPGYGFRLVRTP